MDRAYSVEFLQSAIRDLKQFEGKIRERIINSIATLENEPRPQGCKKLKGSRNRYRIRIGKFRVIYEIKDRIVTVYIITIAHRENVYR